MGAVKNPMHMQLVLHLDSMYVRRNPTINHTLGKRSATTVLVLQGQAKPLLDFIEPGKGRAGFPKPYKLICKPGIMPHVATLIHEGFGIRTAVGMQKELFTDLPGSLCLGFRVGAYTGKRQT